GQRLSTTGSHREPPARDLMGLGPDGVATATATALRGRDVSPKRRLRARAHPEGRSGRGLTAETAEKNAEGPKDVEPGSGRSDAPSRLRPGFPGCPRSHPPGGAPGRPDAGRGP